MNVFGVFIPSVSATQMHKIIYVEMCARACVCVCVSAIATMLFYIDTRCISDWVEHFARRTDDCTFHVIAVRQPQQFHLCSSLHIWPNSFRIHHCKAPSLFANACCYIRIRSRWWQCDTTCLFAISFFFFFFSSIQFKPTQKRNCVIWMRSENLSLGQ